MKSNKLTVGPTLGVAAAMALAMPAEAAKRGKYKEVAVTDGGTVEELKHGSRARAGVVRLAAARIRAVRD